MHVYLDRSDAHVGIPGLDSLPVRRSRASTSDMPRLSKAMKQPCMSGRRQRKTATSI